MGRSLQPGLFDLVHVGPFSPRLLQKSPLCYSPARQQPPQSRLLEGSKRNTRMKCPWIVCEPFERFPNYYVLNHGTPQDALNQNRQATQCPGLETQTSRSRLAWNFNSLCRHRRGFIPWTLPHGFKVIFSIQSLRVHVPK